jgi:hypothetical protein
MASLVALSPGCALVDSLGANETQDAGPDSCLGIASCVEDPDSGLGPGQPDAAPPSLLSDAGPDLVVAVGDLVQLDGSDSSGALTYLWELSLPEESSASLSSTDAARTSFVPDLEGVYEATLWVYGSGVDYSVDQVTITAQVMFGSAGPDRRTYTGTGVTVGDVAEEPAGPGDAYSWTILSAPPGSTAALDDPTIARPVLVPDQDGRYELQLVVSDDGVDEEPDVVAVTSYRPIDRLEHRVVDAEYSRALDRLILVAEQPNRLYILNPATGTETSANLGPAPTAVAVSPTGGHAAVAHDGWVSRVNLTTRAVVTHRVEVPLADIVMTTDDRAFAMPSYDSYDGMQCLNLTSGESFRAVDDWMFHTGGSHLKLDPSTSRIYAANNGVSPSDIGRFDVASGTATYRYDSPYHGKYSMCGDLWMSDDGARIFTRCGAMFRTSQLPANDMEYNGSIPGVGYIRHLDHSSAAGKLVVLPSDDVVGGDRNSRKKLRVYDTSDPLSLDRQIDLSPFLDAGADHPAYGRFAFISADNTKVFVIIQADERSGLLNDHALVIYDLN